MNAVITLLASFVIALFFIGPYLSARFAIELLIVKQPAKAQTSTEELARSFLFSIPFVAVATLLVWLAYHHRYAFDPGVLDRVFAGQSTFVERWSAAYNLWPLRTVLIVTYVEVGLFVCLVFLAAQVLPRTPPSNKRLSWNYFFKKITSPYLKSEWDVLAGRILLRPHTEVLADVATKSGKIFLGTLAGVTTNADGSLRYLQLSNPSIRAQKDAVGSAPGTGAGFTDRLCLSGQLLLRHPCE